jgi:undecaprenyl-diphosphatase
LALSTATRGQAPKTLLRDLRAGVACADVESIPLERLVRVRPRTLLTIAALMGAFYFLLPQLAHVDDSFAALRSANWAWLLVSALMSMATYVFAAIALGGGVPDHIPLAPTVGAQMASSFLNRVTPANVGGMTLNVRFLRKAGVEPAVAVTAVGLNSLAGALAHAALMALFFTWAGQSGGGAFTIPGGSKLLVAVAAVLALLGVVAATRRGRRLVRTHLIANVKRSLSSIVALARSPVKLAALFGGSAGITVAYIAALAAAVSAFHGHVTFAEVGAVYLGSSVIAAAAPTPGGLGALEAALVAGLTGVGMAPGPAVAAVLGYRLVTYWLPILPGWIGLRSLERRGYV